MKKSFAIILSLAMVLSLATAFFAVALTTSAAGAESNAPAEADLYQTMSSSVDIYVGSAKTTLTDGQSMGTADGLTAGTASFSAGTLTLNGTNGITKVESNNGGTLVVKIVGTNTLSNPGQNRSIRVAGSKSALVITADAGTNVLNSTAGAYAFYAQGHIWVDGHVTIDVTTTGVNAFQAAGGTITVAENAIVTAKASARALQANGVETGIYLRDSAVVTATTTSSSNAAIEVSDSSTRGIIDISGNAQVTVNAKNVGIYARSSGRNLVYIRDSADVTVTAGNMGIQLDKAAEFYLTDTATADVAASSVALYVNGTGTTKAIMTSSGTSSFERTNLDAGGAAVSFNANNASTKVEAEIKNGVYNIVGHSRGTNNSVLKIGGNASGGVHAEIDVLIEDAQLNVINDYAKTTAGSQALFINGKDGSTLKILGNSIVNVSVSSTVENAGVSALKSQNVDITVADSAILNVEASGAALGDASSAINLISGANLTVEDEAIVAASAADGLGIAVSDGKVALEGGLAKLYGPEGAAPAGAVVLGSGAKIQAGESPDGALADINNTFPYASKYVQVNIGNVADVPEITVTLSDGTDAVLLRNAPWNTVTAGSGSVTYKEGVLTLNNATAKAVAVSGADLSVNAKGTNTLSGNGFSSDRDLTVTGEKLNFTGAKAFTVAGTLTLSDDLAVSADVTGVAFTLEGTNPGLVITDNVAVDVVGDTHAIYVNPDAAGTGTFIVADYATVNVNSAGVPIYYESSAENIISLTSSGTSVFHRTGSNAAFFITNSKKNTVEIKNGDYTFSGQGGNNHNAVFRIDGGNPSGVDGFNGKACDIDFVIENANVTVKRTQNNSVAMAMRLFGNDGSTMKILGDSTVTVDAPSNVANADISALYADNVDITVSGNSILAASARGTGSSNAKATSGAVRLVDADLTVEDNAEVEAYAPKGGSGISVTNGNVNLKGGIIDVSGAPAINNAAALKVASGATVKAGDKRVNAKAVDSYTGEAYALIKTEGAHEFVDITVTLADGTKHTFSRKADTLTWNKGEITYDYANGVLTLDDATEVKSLVIGEGDLNVKLVGKNEIVNVGANALNTSLNGGVLKFVGDGTLLLESDKSAALQASGTGGQWVFAEKAQVIAYSPSSSLRTSGPDVAIIVTDNANVMTAGSEDTDLGSIYAYATKSSLVEVSGHGVLRAVDNANAISIAAPEAILRASENGVLVASGGRFGAYVNSSAANGLAMIEATGNADAEVNARGVTEFQSGLTYAAAYVVASGNDANATVKASDNAQIRMIGGDKYIAAQIKASKNVANLIVEDSAALTAENSGTATLWMNAAKAINADLTTDNATSVTRNGDANGAAFYLQPGAADTAINVNIKNGTASFLGSSGGINNGVVNIGYNAADPRNEKVNVNIEDAYVTVTNNYTGGTAQSVGLRVFGADGSFNVKGNSVVVIDVTSTKSGAALYGLYNSCVDVNLADSSIMYVATNGVKAAESGAALMLRHADMTVADKAELDAFSNNGGYGITLTHGNNIYFKGGISEFFGSAVTDNILAFKRGENTKVYTGASAAEATDDFQTFSGLEKYARINVGDLTEQVKVSVTLEDGSTRLLVNPWNTLKLGSGTIDFDSATGILTMQNARVQNILAKTGDLTVVVNGNNGIKSTDAYGIVTENGNLTVKGDGNLDIDVKNNALASLNGDLTVTGDVTVNAKASAPVIYVGGDNNDLTFSGNAKVTATGTGASIIRNVTPSGFTYIKDNAQVTVVNSEPSSWGSAFDTSNFEISGGVLDLTAAGSKNTAFVGLAVSVQKAEMEAGAKAGVANFKGGKVIVKVQNDSAVKNEEDETVADSRGYGLFFKNLEEINFAGTEIDITVTNKTGSVDAQKVNNRAAVTWQSDNGVATKVNLTAGTLKITADKNTAGLLASAANSTFTMKGGSLLGEAATLFAAGASGTKFTINGGMVDFKAHGSIVGTSSKPTVKVNASILKGAADTESKILVIGNPATSALPIAIITVTALAAVAGTVVILRKRRKTIG